MNPENGAHPPPIPTQSQYALYAALQTMKKRCLMLQQRLTSVEEENLGLRQQRETAEAPDDHQRESLQHLHAQIEQLSAGRQQATERLQMMATENRQLWARLSQLTRQTPDEAPLTAALNVDDLSIDDDVLKMNSNGRIDVAPHQSSANHLNLIRSKTFTQNAPNPALRVRMTDLDAAMRTGPGQRSSGRMAAPTAEDISLEEISLKVLNEFLEKKAEAEKLYTDISMEMAADPANTPAVDSFGFGYLTEDDGNEADSSGASDLQAELKRCADGMADIRKEVLSQQSDIKVALSNLRQRRFLQVCPSCKRHLRQAGIRSNSPGAEDPTAQTPNAVSAINATAAIPATSVELREQKRIADGLEKTCPMCAKCYSSTVTFDAYQEHVESHFVDNSELPDASFDFEQNFEMISHAVGDF